MKMLHQIFTSSQCKGLFFSSLQDVIISISLPLLTQLNSLSISLSFFKLFPQSWFYQHMEVVRLISQLILMVRLYGHACAPGLLLDEGLDLPVHTFGTYFDSFSFICHAGRFRI